MLELLHDKYISELLINIVIAMSLYLKGSYIMNKEKLGRKGYEKYENKASDYINDTDKAIKLLDDARKKADKKKGPLKDMWGKAQLFFNIFDDCIKGRYTVPRRSIIMIIVAILYFVIPIDLIPDFIIGLGYGDDIAVLGFVISQINKDLNKYKAWKEEQINGAVDEEEDI